MSLYINNGTTAVKVKKRYKSNGSTLRQVKKRYKSNGTSLEQTYSAEEWLLQNGMPKDFELQSVLIDCDSHSEQTTPEPVRLALQAGLSNKSWKAARNAKYTKNKVNVTGIDKIKVTFDVWHSWGGTLTGVCIGLTNDLSYPTIANGYGEYKAQPGNGYTFELDVSKITGEYHIFFGVFCWIEGTTGSCSVEAAFYDCQLI